jgi:hypothetical protein
MAATETLAGVIELQSVPAVAELALIAEVETSVEAEALALTSGTLAEALALTSGTLAEALALTSGTLADTLALTSGRLAETLALTSPLAEALTLWARAGADRVQAASSSAASEYLDMGSLLSSYLSPAALQHAVARAVAPAAKQK